MTMTPFYQTRSREHEKSESGLHGKNRICPRLYRFFWYRRSKNPTFCSQNEKCKTCLTGFVFAIFYSIRLKNDDVSVNGFSLFSMQLATCFIVVLISLEIICRSEGHIHANHPKNEGKVLFQVCHIRSKLVKYSAGLYVKPSNYRATCPSP